MRVLLDGFYVLNHYKEGCIIFLVSVLGFGGWGKRFFQIDSQRYFMPKLFFALSLGGLILIPLSFVLVLFGRIWNPILKSGSLLIVVLGLVALVDWIRRDRVAKRPSDLIFSCLFVIAILLARLAFLKGIVLPPYDDSPEHYMIVRDLLTPNGNHNAFYSIETLTNRYYHLGFHSLAAWFSSASYLDVADSIALLGQLFLVILPISVFLLVYSATHSITAGFVAMSLSAFAWRMPAFASNWGKYPAIVGMSLFPAVVGLWILYWRGPGRKILATMILIIVTAALVFVHSRLAICLALVLVSFLLTQKLFSNIKINLLKASLLILLANATFFLFREYFMVFFENGHYLAIILVILLMPFCFYYTPQLFVSVILFSAGVWIVSRIPIFIHGYSTTLLDKPFIEILLCIPISILGGAGFAGFLDHLQNPALRRMAYVIVAMIIVFSFVSADSVYPDICCNYVMDSDVQAIQWLEENSSSSAIIWIAAFKKGNYMVATDAGAWVHPLTGRNANKLNFDFEWSLHNSIDRICRSGYEDVYIYKGGGLYSFVDKILADQKWLVSVFTSGETKIYKAKDSCIYQPLD